MFRDGPRDAWDFLSAVSSAQWPAQPTKKAAETLALLFQLEQSQWLSSQELLRRQFAQLDLLLRHAVANVPYYTERLRGIYDPSRPLDPNHFATLPILKRRDLQEHFDELTTRNLPHAHGAVTRVRSSGSTGAPIQFLRTEVAARLWNAMTLRDHLWQRRDFARKLAVIRGMIQSSTANSWGIATEDVVKTGPCVVRSVSSDAEEHLAWLGRERPAYLLTYPSLVAEIARQAIENRERLEGILEVRTFGEVLPSKVRDLCRNAWGVRVTDGYSAEEVGILALQCPLHEHYHVQSEGVLVEVVDEAGRMCSPGETGRVVASVLHSHAMPLLRYEIGDYAEIGDPCPCGRGLPVLRRVAGRVRNMLVTSSGEKFWPVFNSRQYLDIAPIRQMQFVQKEIDLLEARLMTAVPLDTTQEEKILALLRDGLPNGFRVVLSYPDSIQRTPGGKYEDFISEVTFGGARQ